MAFKTWIISRHPGAQTFLADLGVTGKRLTHLNVEDVRAGDVVIGTLPLPMIAELCQRDVEYWHISLNVNAADRGKELSACQMKARGVRIERFHALRVVGHAV